MDFQYPLGQDDLTHSDKKAIFPLRFFNGIVLRAIPLKSVGEEIPLPPVPISVFVLPPYQNILPSVTKLLVVYPPLCNKIGVVLPHCTKIRNLGTPCTKMAKRVFPPPHFLIE